MPRLLATLNTILTGVVFGLVAVVCADGIDSIRRRAAQPIGPAEPPPSVAPTVITPTVISLNGAHTRGSRAAPVAVVTFSSFACVLCGQFARNSWPILEARMNAGDVLVAFRHFFSNRQRSSLRFAQMVECAGQEGKFWRMHDVLFAASTEVDEADLARDAGVGGSSVFAACLRAQPSTRIDEDRRAGALIGVEAAPHVIVGWRQGESLTVTDIIIGDVAASRLERAIRRALEQRDAPSPIKGSE